MRLGQARRGDLAKAREAYQHLQCAEGAAAATVIERARDTGRGSLTLPRNPHP